MPKTALITGGNKGLGIFQSRAFLQAGYTLYVASRSKGDFASLEDEFGADHVKFLAHDLAASGGVGLIEEVTDQAGGIDVLVNNAGVHLKKPVWEVEPEELDHVLNINLKALFSLSGAFVRLNKERGGAIVNVSSMAGLMALPSAAAYVSSKTAVIGLTRSVAVDAAPFGIRCNAVCPGFIDTDMTRAILAKDPKRRARIERRIPTGKFGAPVDVANACLFLASEQAQYINGVALPVDAGFSIGF